MYRRYSQAGDGSMSFSQINRNRVKNIIILLLVIAIGILLYISIPLMRNRDDSRELYIQRMQSECEDAVRQTASLSRNAGADSAAILARVRSSIYAIRTMNSVYTSTGGHLLVEEERLVTLLNTVDRYMSFLTTGMDTGEYQTNLQNALGELQGLLSPLR